MNALARFYKNREQVEEKDVRSDLAAKQYAGRMDYDSIEISSVYGGSSPRYYILTQSDGRVWHGPWAESGWRWQYLGERGVV